jgi:hypothetical protein
MPSTRRVKILGLLIVICVVTILFWTSSNRAPDSQSADEFYSKTIKGLNKKPDSIVDDEEIARQMALRLKEAAQLAKNNANAKAPKPDPPSAVVGMGNAAEGASGERAVAGRKKFTSGAGEGQEPVKEETEEEHEVTEALNGILKKSPSKFPSPRLYTPLFLSLGLIGDRNSYHILEVVLSPFSSCKRHSARQIHH